MTTLRKVTCKTCGKVANWADEYGPAFGAALCACAKAGVPALQWTSTPPSEPCETVLVKYSNGDILCWSVQLCDGELYAELHDAALRLDSFSLLDDFEQMGVQFCVVDIAEESK